jgi:hypothetical protein
MANLNGIALQITDHRDMMNHVSDALLQLASGKFWNEVRETIELAP